MNGPSGSAGSIAPSLVTAVTSVGFQTVNPRWRYRLDPKPKREEVRLDAQPGAPETVGERVRPGDRDVCGALPAGEEQQQLARVARARDFFHSLGLPGG